MGGTPSKSQYSRGRSPELRPLPVQPKLAVKLSSNRLDHQNLKGAGFVIDHILVSESFSVCQVDDVLYVVNKHPAQAQHQSSSPSAVESPAAEAKMTPSSLIKIEKGDEITMVTETDVLIVTAKEKSLKLRLVNLKTLGEHRATILTESKYTIVPQKFYEHSPWQDSKCFWMRFGVIADYKIYSSSGFMRLTLGENANLEVAQYPIKNILPVLSPRNFFAYSRGRVLFLAHTELANNRFSASLRTARLDIDEEKGHSLFLDEREVHEFDQGHELQGSLYPSSDFNKAIVKVQATIYGHCMARKSMDLHVFQCADEGSNRWEKVPFDLNVDTAHLLGGSIMWGNNDDFYIHFSRMTYRDIHIYQFSIQGGAINMDGDRIIRKPKGRGLGEVPWKIHMLPSGVAVETRGLDVSEFLGSARQSVKQEYLQGCLLPFLCRDVVSIVCSYATTASFRFFPQSNSGETELLELDPLNSNPLLEKTTSAAPS